MLRRAALLACALVCACAYVLPATWRSYRADPDDAAPAITRALDKRQLEVATWDQTTHEIATGWMTVSTGLDRVRERFLVSWELDDDDGTLTIYVRHQAQEQTHGEGAPQWGATYHDSAKEAALLDAITAELRAAGQPLDP